MHKCPPFSHHSLLYITRLRAQNPFISRKKDLKLPASNDKYATNRTGNSSIISGNRVTYRIVVRISTLPLNAPIGQVSLARRASVEQVLFPRRKKPLG